MPAYALTILSGAFLLFQVQPLLGKYILPWFGGGPGVWTTCMLFFQVVLLAGYAYAHFSARLLKPRAQAVLHLALLAASLALLPITPSEGWKPRSSAHPVASILLLLAANVGAPYFVLSSTGPLVQEWFARAYPDRSPYRLYALSNAASLLALVSYPFLVENHLTRTAQATLWGCGLIAYAICCGWCAVRMFRLNPGLTATDFSAATAPLVAESLLHSLLWFLLPACASVLLLAVTNKLCQDVAVIPFLWVLPLALYLLSFVVCFDSPRWYLRVPYLLAFVASSAGIAWALFKGTDVTLKKQIALYSAGLFFACMVCHGELYRLKPGSKRLTGFYLAIAAGGAFGGFLVAVVAPMVFNGFFELQWGIVGCALLVFVLCLADRSGARLARLTTSALLGLTIAGITTAFYLQHRKAEDQAVYHTRNFYGVLTLFDCEQTHPQSHYVLLEHGRITHGLQFADPEKARWPTTYYGEESGIGLGINALPKGPRRVGLVGLGTGTLTSYARPGDAFRIYEINPDVQRLAASRFTYLSNCLGRAEVVLGDARLSLEREAPQHFDLLALDAFSSDAIPVHLLTKEAFSLYERHLNTNSIIAVHVSNHYLDLIPVVLNVARNFHYEVAAIDYDEDEDRWWLYPSTWLLLSHDRQLLASPAIKEAAYNIETNAIKIPLWTDDFASLYQILK